jgi:hypothetical protein
VAHDVFISYSQHDKSIADAVCAALEQSRIRCWIAPRDVPPSRSWPAAIVEAIEQCSMVVLILTQRSNGSADVRKEVHLAVEEGKPVLPFRTEDLRLDPELKYHLGRVHWLDAITPPVEAHIRNLTDKVRAMLPAGSMPTPPGPLSLPPSLPPSLSPSMPPPPFGGSLEPGLQAVLRDLDEWIQQLPGAPVRTAIATPATHGVDLVVAELQNYIAALRDFHKL